MTQFLAVGGIDDDALCSLLASGWTAIDGFVLPAAPWAVTDVVCCGSVTDDEALADALEVAARGASLSVLVADPQVDALFDDAGRLDLAAWDFVTAESTETALDDWVPLLAELAGGASVAQAARSCDVSLPSAYRRLGQARRALGATSNTAAIVTWAAQTRD